MIKADTLNSETLSVVDHSLKTDYRRGGTDVFGEIFSREFVSVDKSQKAERTTRSSLEDRQADDRLDDTKSTYETPLHTDRPAENSQENQNTIDETAEAPATDGAGVVDDSGSEPQQTANEDGAEDNGRNLNEENADGESIRANAVYLLQLAAQNVTGNPSFQTGPSEGIVQQSELPVNAKGQQPVLKDPVIVPVNPEGTNEPIEKTAEVTKKPGDIEAAKINDLQKSQQATQLENVKTSPTQGTESPTVEVVVAKEIRKQENHKPAAVLETTDKEGKAKADTSVTVSKPSETLQPAEKQSLNPDRATNVPEKVFEVNPVVQRDSGQGEQGRADVQNGSAKIDNVTRVTSSPVLQDPGQAGQTDTTQSRENVNRVVKAARAALTQGSSQIQIRLDPPELGHLRISIRHLQSGMQVQLQATNARAMHMIEQSSGELRAALEGQGIQATQIDVQLRSDLRNDQSTSQGQDPGQPSDQANGDEGQDQEESFSDYLEGSEDDQNDPDEQELSQLREDDHDGSDDFDNRDQEYTEPLRVDLKV